jgi:hypothetical protein
LFPSREPSIDGPSESSPSSRPVLPERRRVEDEAGIPEKELVRFTDELAQAAASRSGADNGATGEARGQQQSPPPQYPTSEASASSAPFRPPPPFSSLFTTDSPSLDLSVAAATVLEPCEPYKASVTDADNLAAFGESSSAAPAYAPSDHQPVVPESSSAARSFQDETKRALPQDTKAGESSRKDEEAEPPPAYSEGSSPLQSFTYLMAAAGGAASIITQVQQGGPPISSLGGEIAATRYVFYEHWLMRCGDRCWGR